MLAVLHRDPVRRSTAAVRPIAPLRHQTLQAHPAGCPKQIGPDCTDLEWVDKDAVRTAAQKTLKVGLAHRQRQVAQIVAVDRQHIEGAELHLGAALARVQRVEIGDAEDHRFAVDNELLAMVAECSLGDSMEIAWSSRNRRG